MFSSWYHLREMHPGRQKLGYYSVRGCFRRVVCVYIDTTGRRETSLHPYRHIGYDDARGHDRICLLSEPVPASGGTCNG